MAESGYRAAQAVEWFGLFLPAKTSGDAVNRLNAALREALKARPLQDALAKASFEIAASESAKDFTQQFHADLNRWGEIVKLSGFTPED